MRRGHLGQAPGGLVEPGEDLLSLPLVVGAQLVEFTCGGGAGSRGFCACVLRPRVGGRGALIGLRGLREGLVAGVTGGADKRLGLGLVGLGPCDRAVAVFLGDGDARLGFLADLVELGGVGGGGLSQALVSSRARACSAARCSLDLLGGLVCVRSHLVSSNGPALSRRPLVLCGSGPALGGSPG